MMVNKIYKVLVLVLILLAGKVLAEQAQTDPIQFMKAVTDQLMGELKKNQEKIEKDPESVYEVIYPLISSYVDFEEMAKWVAGTKAWYSADGKTRESFIIEFKTLVVRTYGLALNKYITERIEFLPLKKSASKTRIQVSSRVTRANKEDLHIDYRLITHDDSWRVYDLIAEGFSILEVFQAQFSDQIHREGLSVVVKKIREHNEKI